VAGAEVAPALRILVCARGLLMCVSVRVREHKLMHVLVHPVRRQARHHSLVKQQQQQQQGQGWLAGVAAWAAASTPSRLKRLAGLLPLR
jgi:hypothetical protein